MAKSQSGESIVQRIVRILDVFGPKVTALPVTELAARAKLPVSTTSRLVDQLVEAGFLARDGQRRIRVGVRLWELAVTASPASVLRNAALPFMAELHAALGQHVQLCVLRDGEVLVIERLSDPRVEAIFSHIGGRLPAHASAAGQVLLAHVGRLEQQEVFDRGLQQFTERTVTDIPRLRRRLVAVRRADYAYCDGHLHPRAASLAVPVRAASGAVIAAMAIVSVDEQCSSHLPLLRAAAAGLSSHLGHSARDIGVGPDVPPGVSPPASGAGTSLN